MKKQVSMLLAAMLLLTLFAACGKAAAEPDMDTLVAGIDTAIGNDGTMSAVDENYIKGSMKMDVSDYEAYTVKINAKGANIDEYGVFKGKDAAQAKEIKTAVENYLQMRKDTWVTAYMPEERPKLDAAQIWTEGSYVMYAILSDDAKTAASTAFTQSFEG